MEVIFLGTSGCVPTETRNLSSILVNYLNQPYLFDCGEGTQRQMRLAGVNFMKIDHIFLTHLHADHFLGLGGMIQSMDFMERTRELNIYGPKETEETINKLLSAGTFILDHLTVKVHEIQPGLVLDDSKFTITCAKTIHTSNSLAYCFEEKSHRKFLKQKALSLGVPEGRLFSQLQEGREVTVKGKTIKPEDVLDIPIVGRKVVYTGDTRPCNNVIKLAENADLLIHDGTFSHEEKQLVEESAHTTNVQAAEIAIKANVKKLYLTHISQRYPKKEDIKKMVEEARKIFKQTYIAEDLQKVEVEKHW
ncbi:MAG: ribonuclease Z [Candidatus Altiarchaeales archaeon]|nr:ribonuclease Z [Candidatus Altiarchaeales archaeon]